MNYVGKIDNMEKFTRDYYAFWGQVNQDGPGGCWVWTGPMRGGYGVLYLAREGTVAAHRHSWRIHNGEIPKGKLVLHKCDNPPCVNPAHLKIGTHKQNSRDCVRRGRHRCVRLSRPKQ